jgi:S1-C subfamily serine protease
MPLFACFTISNGAGMPKQVIRRNPITLALAVVLVVAFAIVLRGETITLKDGTVLQGVVIPRGDDYWVKTSDGQTRLIPGDQVDHIGGPAPTPPVANGTGASPSASPGVSPGAIGAPAVTGSDSFLQTKGDADEVDAPILAVIIWEKFIDAKPSPTDLASAKIELAHWKQLDAEHAEKINGKWVGGEDRRKLLHHVSELIRQAREEMQGDQTLDAVSNLEQALRLYPNSFEANFELGLYYLEKGVNGGRGVGNVEDFEKALTSLETAARVRPDSAATLSNLAIGYNFRRRYEEAVLSAYKAVKIEDNQATVQNLVDSIAHAPPAMRTSNETVRPIAAEAAILAAKHGIGMDGGMWIYARPHPPGVDANGKPTDNAPGTDGDDGDDAPPGVVASGSGFFITSDGYFLTNKHVAGEKNRSFRVRFDDGTEKNADVVALDDQNDIALMHVKVDQPTPCLQLAASDTPNPAAHVMVLGYPASFQLGFKMQVTTGDVTSVDELDAYPVTLTLNTTHGNSGGPIIDKDENVVGILSAGEQIYNVTYVKAISAGEIRSFLDKNKDKFPESISPGPSTRPEFDGESLAREARRATLLVLIIKGAA